jgi:hypothetical protein
MIGVALVAALLASSATIGPDMFDIFWFRPGGQEWLYRKLTKGPPPAAAESVAVAPGGAAAAISDNRHGVAFRIFPGDVRLEGARAAAFSPDGLRVAAALGTGKIVATGLDGGAPELLGRVPGARRLAWGAGVVAAGKSGATLLPKLVLTRAKVYELIAKGDRIALTTASELLLFDGKGSLLRRVKAKASALALSAGGVAAYAVGSTVWLVDSASPPKLQAREHERIAQIAFIGESPSWIAHGAHRADGAALACARFLDTTRGLLATCSDKVFDWEGAPRAVHEAGDSFVKLVWTVPLGDGLLVGQLLRDRRFSTSPADLRP